ncbi:unnamed protein product [Brugia pahangi]|uniref:Pkinase_Tyr domain-containing protein n=1 Tax=Brugia pahangi TaxID=6280 RepID=A0A0N4TGC0_BRUPA|nr:unnamed protein product [Brugia pahangi]
MKTLGYHERLVNMLACITETEPYCLIVEYCSDGDLLHFLRKRCAYMIKLTEMGIDYDEPNLNEKIDQDLVITLKQLLMFAVQISYGLVRNIYIQSLKFIYFICLYIFHSKIIFLLTALFPCKNFILKLSLKNFQLKFLLKIGSIKR